MIGALTDLFLTIIAEAVITAGTISILAMRLDERLSSWHLTWFGSWVIPLALLLGGFWGVIMGARILPSRVSGKMAEADEGC